jgi:dolichyl-phosphate-mannose--protein O-mannosyl transferase
MNIMHSKAWLAALWIVALATIGLTVGVTSAAGWLGLVGLAVVPIVILSSLWQSPAQTTSESIKDAIR